MPTLLSTMWTFLSLNYILCDVLSNMESGVLKGLMVGSISGIPVSQGFLLLAGIMLEIPIMMIILSRVLKRKANRWTNIIAGILLIVNQVGSFSFGTPATLHYIAFSAVEIAGNLLIIGLAWKWRDAEA